MNNIEIVAKQNNEKILILGEMAKKVYGIEIVEQAIEDARANIPIVPIPQYKSQTTSSFVMLAFSIPILYKASACIGFT